GRWAVRSGARRRLFRRVDVHPYIRCLESGVGLARAPAPDVGISPHGLPTIFTTRPGPGCRSHPPPRLSRSSDGRARPARATWALGIRWPVTIGNVFQHGGIMDSVYVTTGVGL